MRLDVQTIENIANHSKSSEEFLKEVRALASDPTIRKIVERSCLSLGLEGVKLSGYFEAYTRNLDRLGDELVKQDIGHLVFLAGLLKSREDFAERATRTFAEVISSPELGSAERREAVRLRLMKEFCETIGYPLSGASQEEFAKIYDHVQNQERLRLANEEAEKVMSGVPKGAKTDPRSL